MTPNDFKILFPVLAISLMVWSGKSFSKVKPDLTKMTSAKSSQEVSAKLPAESRVSNDLNVHSVGIGVGQTFLAGDFNKRGNDGITADLYYNYSASHSFDFFTNFHHSKHTLGGKEARLTGLALGIKGKAYQFDAFSPFVLGGLGFYSPKVKRFINNKLSESESAVTFGWNIGLGADLKLNPKFSVGVLWHYHNPFDVKQEADSDVEGSYSKLLITTLYSFK